MRNVVEFRTEYGPIYIEVADIPPLADRTTKASHGTVAKSAVEKAAASFDEALGTILSTASTFVRNANALAKPPSELTVEFGLKTSGAVKAFVVSCDAEANFALKMTWKKDGTK